jgi:hypothetical protein
MRFSTNVKTPKGLIVPSLVLSPFISLFLLIAQTLATIECAHAQAGSAPKSAGAKTPKGIQAHETEGRKAAGEGHFQIAVKEFTLVLKQQPQRVDMLLARADAHYKALEIDEARLDCERAIKL